MGGERLTATQSRLKSSSIEHLFPFYPKCLTHCRLVAKIEQRGSNERVLTTGKRGRVF